MAWHNIAFLKGPTVAFLLNAARVGLVCVCVAAPDPLVRSTDFDPQSMGDVLEFQKPSAQTDSGDWYGQTFVDFNVCVNAVMTKKLELQNKFFA